MDPGLKFARPLNLEKKMEGLRRKNQRNCYF